MTQTKSTKYLQSKLNQFSLIYEWIPFPFPFEQQLGGGFLFITPLTGPFTIPFPTPFDAGPLTNNNTNYIAIFKPIPSEQCRSSAIIINMWTSTQIAWFARVIKI
jgi:hypothetical protein